MGWGDVVCGGCEGSFSYDLGFVKCVFVVGLYVVSFVDGLLVYVYVFCMKNAPWGGRIGVGGWGFDVFAKSGALVFGVVVCGLTSGRIRCLLILLLLALFCLIAGLFPEGGCLCCAWLWPL